MNEVDVIVVGLGPTGATLAGLLGQRGLRVAVFERLADLFPLPRAAGFDHEVMRIVQELGVADRMAKHVAPYRPSEYRGMEGQLIKRIDAAPPPYRLGWAPNWVFEQPAFEGALRARLRELPHVSVATATEVVSVGQDADGAWVDVRMPDADQVQRTRARYVIACDGGSSPIRKQLGIALEDLGFDEPWLVVDAIVNDDKLAQLPQTQVQYCEAARPSTYVVGVGNHRRWELMLNPGDSLATQFPDEELWPLLKRWLRPGEGRIWRSAAYRFHGLVAREWRQGRVVLAGDAAHMTPPFMAQGMVQGLRDAANLAWKLELVIRKGAPDALLDTYQQERHSHVSATTRAAMALGHLICERDPVRAHERDARLIAEQGGEVKTTVRQNLIPGLAGGLIAPGSPGAGSILPQPFVHAEDFAGRLDDLTGASLRLISASPLGTGERDALLALLQPADGVLVELGQAAASGRGLVCACEDDGLCRSWLQEMGQRFALARPDHYVYGTAASVDQAIALLNDYRAALKL